MTRKGESNILTSLTPDPSPKGEGSGYLWWGMALLIIILGGGAWFVVRRKNESQNISLPSPLGEGSGVRLLHLKKSRAELSEQCKQVIEEPTKRGFRVKLII